MPGDGVCFVGVHRIRRVRLELGGQQRLQLAMFQRRSCLAFGRRGVRAPSRVPLDVGVVDRTAFRPYPMVAAFVEPARPAPDQSATHMCRNPWLVTTTENVVEWMVNGP